MIKRKDLLGLVDASAEEICEILDTAANMKRLLRQGIKKLPHLEGCTATILFYENSTRTRTSFELAAKYMGATTINIAASSSSVAKGETLIDTGKTLDAMKNDFIIIRHPMGGAPYLLARTVKAGVINAGDGGHYHPTQTLADLMTIHRHKSSFENLTVALCGDLKYGRTVHSLIEAMSRYKGIQFVLISPEELKIPGFIRYNVFENQGIPYTEVSSLEEAMPKLDVLYMTRIQRERFDDPWEYERLKDSYVLDTEKMKLAKGKMCVLHPLPRVNEISVKVDDDPRAAYFRQALNGKYMRMALILKLLDEAARNPAKEAIDTTGLEYDRVCRNPKCITQTEQELPQLFRCTDKAADIHRCIYCEQRA